MDNPFFKNNGPLKYSDILKYLCLKNDENNQDVNIIDIKDLKNSTSNEITFFHSKKYKTIANNSNTAKISIPKLNNSSFVSMVCSKSIFVISPKILRINTSAIISYCFKSEVVKDRGIKKIRR